MPRLALSCALLSLVSASAHAQCRPDIDAAVRLAAPGLEIRSREPSAREHVALDADLDGDGGAEHVVALSVSNEESSAALVLVFGCATLRAHRLLSDARDPSGSLSGAPHSIASLRAETVLGATFVRLELLRSGGGSEERVSRRTLALLGLSGDVLTPAFECVTHDDYEETDGSRAGGIRDVISGWRVRRTVLLPSGRRATIRVRRQLIQLAEGRASPAVQSAWVAFTFDGARFLDTEARSQCEDDGPSRE